MSTIFLLEPITNTESLSDATEPTTITESFPDAFLRSEFDCKTKTWNLYFNNEKLLIRKMSYLTGYSQLKYN
jgi:hypothetical protein